jgi:plasmid stabilization system protein ParE
MKKRYRVVITAQAKADFDRSYEWGRRTWGDSAARRWYREIKSQILRSLSTLPFGHPIAPESEEHGSEIRHMIISRYRVLFEVEGKTIRVMHLRASYVDPGSRDLGVDE